MALDKSKLASEILGVIAAFPATADAAGAGLANAYDAYASDAQSCAGLNPTLVNLVALSDGLKDTLNDDTQDAEECAEAWRDALVLYWTGALFGPTGTVVLPIAGAAVLATALENLFVSQAAASPPVPFPTSADALADLIHAFTTTVQVTDTGIPCGPLPIT